MPCLPEHWGQGQKLVWMAADFPECRLTQSVGFSWMLNNSGAGESCQLFRDDHFRHRTLDAITAKQPQALSKRFLAAGCRMTTSAWQIAIGGPVVKQLHEKELESCHPPWLPCCGVRCQWLTSDDVSHSRSHHRSEISTCHVAVFRDQKIALHWSYQQPQWKPPSPSQVKPVLDRSTIRRRVHYSRHSL